MRDKSDFKGICAWLNIHLSPEERINVLYFLAGVAAIDGMINGREQKLIRIACEKLQLTQKDFDSVIATYTQRKQRSKSTSTHSYKSALKLSCEILGVSEFASMDEIKKAYRKMVKLHHPDRMISASESDKKITRERFIEIQKAYETIEKYK